LGSLLSQAKVTGHQHCDISTVELITEIATKILWAVTQWCQQDQGLDRAGQHRISSHYPERHAIETFQAIVSEVSCLFWCLFLELFIIWV
jgi:hypothetical protein